MATTDISKSLRNRTEQHKAKNTKSKNDDKNIYKAMKKVIEYLKERFKNEANFSGYDIIFERTIEIQYMIDFIKMKNVRQEFDIQFIDRTIVPDGGILFLVKEDSYKKPILISEIKRQGTNDERLKEGKEKQATGNAIERLGKNLTGIKAMMNHEKITPFICFGWGCDFDEREKTVLSKVSMLNEFYPLNRIYIFKRDGSSDYNYFSPVSMFFRNDEWTVEEMFSIMKEVAETALRYYIY
ncbi:restriction endonuclease [Treponema phagedenis]|uniref:EcoRI family type II restriction endonuclease n=1 Tax=Treponema phagedenis TaxID=162 RepID=UPI00197FB4CD|nr:EcoRI family type II restriction endonuclease [Treponema phagedenis]QSH98926.1 restriction endonuclease [Treponema phagedenis]